MQHICPIPVSDVKKFVTAMLLLLLVSCNDTVVCDNDDMKNTFKSGDVLQLEKATTLAKNDVVFFELPKGKKKILRIVGMPGDSIMLYKSKIYINNKLFKLPLSAKRVYVVYCKNPEDFNKLSNYEFSNYSLTYSFFLLDYKELVEIKKMKIADSIYEISLKKNDVNNKLIKNSTFKYKNRDFFGPFVIPQKNEIITPDIVDLCVNFMNNDNLRERVNDDYYFCIGDNLTEAEDSRSLGLIPKKFIKWKVK